MDTRAILSPVVDERPDVDAALKALSSLTSALRAEKFEKIVNLSYSPFSASLVCDLTHGRNLGSDVDGGVEVVGYTRHEDRTLSIPDDASAYFYAQVGVGKGNRLHVTDLFAHAAGVELVEEDWACAKEANCPVVSEANRDGILVHLGASNLSKTLSWSKWLQVVTKLLAQTDAPVILIGSQAEADIAEKVAAVFGSRKPVNMVGRTTIPELFELVMSAQLVIGGDSAPMQMASLTSTPALNLSFPTVSMWETAPRSSGSRILVIESEDSVTSDEIVKEATAVLMKRPPHLPVVRVVERAFVETKPLPQEFEWSLLQALYMNEAFPLEPNSTFSIGLQRLAEVNLLAIEQIAALKKDSTNQTAGLILERVDDVMEHVMQLVPHIGPIVRWFRVERLRIGPMAIEQVIAMTRQTHTRLDEILNLYLQNTSEGENEVLEQK